MNQKGEEKVKSTSVIAIVLLVFLGSSIPAHSADDIYKDPDQPIERRIDSLLSQMTLQEKVNQLLSNYVKLDMAPDGSLAIEPTFREQLEQGLGAVQHVNLQLDAAQDAEFSNMIQRHVRENSRLGIPVFLEGEALHGLIAHKATSFPQAIALASTWDPSLVNRVFTRAALQARSRGNHVMFTPVLDLARDPRWGRMEETYGEDVYMVTQMGLAATTGLQGGGELVGKDNVVSAPKHFAGYGQADGGRNFAPTSIPPRIFHEEILEPFRQVVAKAHVWGIMPSHSEIDGVPAHGNEWLLNTLLREEWGFQGMVVSDYHDIHRLDILHRVAASEEEAVLLALKSGVNLDQPRGESYVFLPQALEAHPEYLPYLDQRVREVLRVKFMLGLFENPFVDEQRALAIQDDPANSALALEAAEKAVILLKNENGLLPLDKNEPKKIALIGPNAEETVLGGYTHRGKQVQSIHDGLMKYLEGTDIELNFAKGCGITSEKAFTQLEAGKIADHRIYTIPYEQEKETIAEAAKLAGESDVAVVVIGDNYFTSREAFFKKGALGDRGDINLVGNQGALAKAVIETGTPTIVVLIHGRSLSINYIKEHADAIVDGWYLGDETATAVARTLFGENNPGGKLVVTVPRSSAHLPVYYSQRFSANWKDYLFEDGPPLFQFGYGLSYTRFELSNIELSDDGIKPGDSVAVTLDITNTGSVDGDEVVQVYLRDVVGSTTRPDKALKAFKRITLAAGEKKRVELMLEPTAFEMIDLAHERVIEPGAFKVLVGTSSRDEDLIELPLMVE
mgnify:CR=1 FL=1